MRRRKTAGSVGAIFAIAVVFLMVFASVPTAACPPCEYFKKVDLIAGQNTDVGYVKVDHDHDTFTVTYKIEDCSWYITETHLALSMIGMDGIPQTKKGSPKVGHFAFSGEHDYVKEVTYTIPFTSDKIAGNDDDGFDWGDRLCLAAHAVVYKKCGDEYVQGETAWGDGTEFPKSWAMYFCYTPCKVPELPSGDIKFWVKTGDDSYFTTTITNGGGGNAPNGEYNGWCVDLTNVIYTGSGNVYDAELLMPPKTCTWAKVNWVINNAPGLDYDRFEMQAVIWSIVLKVPIVWNMHGSNQLSPSQLTDAIALNNTAKGKCGYVPTGDYPLFAVLVKVPGTVQLTIIEVDP